MKIEVYDITANEILKLTREAHHDSASLSRLQIYNERVANAVNRRINTFNRNKIQSPALKKLEHYTKKQRGNKTGKISKSKKQSIEELKMNLLNGIKFLKAKTGTVKGYRDYQRNNMQELSERYGIDISKQDSEKFAEFAQTEFFKYLKEFDSDRILKDFLDFSKTDLTVEEVNRKWKDFTENKETSILDALEGFEEVFGNENLFA